MSTDATTTDLYRFYDTDDRLLYVGISFSAVARASQHRAEKGWWCDVARMDVEHLPTRRDAEDAERRAIKSEGPIHNVVGNGPSSREYVVRSKAVDRRPPISFSAFDMVQAAGYEKVRAMQEAINEVALAMDRAEIWGDRGDFVDSVSAIARSVVYGDWCRDCCDTHYPWKLETNGTGATAHYMCTTHRLSWTCGWTLDLSLLAV